MGSVKFNPFPSQWTGQHTERHCPLHFYGDCFACIRTELVAGITLISEHLCNGDQDFQGGGVIVKALFFDDNAILTMTENPS